MIVVIFGQCFTTQSNDRILQFQLLFVNGNNYALIYTSRSGLLEKIMGSSPSWMLLECFVKVLCGKQP